MSAGHGFLPLPRYMILKLKSFSPKHQQRPEQRRKERKKIVEAPSAAEAFFNERMLKHKKIIRSFLKRKRNQRQKRESESKKRVGILIKRKKRKEKK